MKLTGQGNQQVVMTTTASGMKVLPPIKQSASSLERTTGVSYSTAQSTANGAALQSQRQMTAEVYRVEAFKKRDLRGGKRARQTQLSVGKTSI